MIRAYFAAAIILLGWLTVSAQTTGFFVQPQITDPSIDRDLEPHYVGVNPLVTRKNQLFLHFPGTGGTPANSRDIINTAADLGFHAVGLNYPNDIAVNQACGGTLNPDLNCYANMRLEIKDGVDRTGLVNINRPNSIDNRLIKLLIYLRQQRPSENWGQFLLDEATVNWTRIVVSGHSQGGGHASIIGRHHPVVRVVMFAAMDFNGVANALANWIALPATTPNASAPDKFWGFSHQRDEQVEYDVLSTRVWTAYGMPQFGSVVNVDQAAPPYNNTHSLVSNRECSNFHGCVVVDRALVRDSNNVPIYKLVWQYLLSNTPAPFGLIKLEFLRGGRIVDRPFVGQTTKNYRVVLRGGDFNRNTRVLIRGVEMNTEFISSNEIRAALPARKFGSIGGTIIQIRQSESGQVSNLLSY